MSNEKKEELRFIKQIFIFIAVLIIIIAIGLYAVVQIDNLKFKTSYQYAINLKYKDLVETDSPKIIIVGGSSAAFGINSDIIKNRNNMNVVNVGLHAGFGIEFETEIAKANIQEGDLVVLAYEFNYEEENFNVELIATGIDNSNLEIYKYVPRNKIVDIIKYVPTYVFKKLENTNKKTEGGAYSLEAFDEKGNMIFNREQCILPEELDIEKYKRVEISNLKFKYTEYVNQFYDYCRAKGADVVFTFSPVLDERFCGTDEEIENFETSLKAELKPEVISNIKNYIFTRDYMYDTIYHCNNLGEKLRSEKLAEDIHQYLLKKGDS